MDLTSSVILLLTSKAAEKKNQHKYPTVSFCIFSLCFDINIFLLGKVASRDCRDYCFFLFDVYSIGPTDGKIQEFFSSSFGYCSYPALKMEGIKGLWSKEVQIDLDVISISCVVIALGNYYISLY